MRTEKLTWQHNGMSIELAAELTGRVLAISHVRAMTGGLKSIRTS
jgi:hypothetical protein